VFIKKIGIHLRSILGKLWQKYRKLRKIYHVTDLQKIILM